MRKPERADNSALHLAPRSGPTPAKVWRPASLLVSSERLHETMRQEPTDSQLWRDEGVWIELFQPLFAEDGDLAERTAKLLDYLLLELDKGPMGVTHVGVCLENALRLIFPYTATGRACMILFQVSLGKDFPPQPDTLATLTEAMKRTKAALERGPGKQAKRQRKESRR